MIIIIRKLKTAEAMAAVYKAEAHIIIAWSRMNVSEDNGKFKNCPITLSSK